MVFSFFWVFILIKFIRILSGHESENLELGKNDSYNQFEIDVIANLIKNQQILEANKKLNNLNEIKIKLIVNAVYENSSNNIDLLLHFIDKSKKLNIPIKYLILDELTTKIIENHHLTIRQLMKIFKQIRKNIITKTEYKTEINIHSRDLIYYEIGPKIIKLGTENLIKQIQKNQINFKDELKYINEEIFLTKIIRNVFQKIQLNEKEINIFWKILKQKLLKNLNYWQLPIAINIFFPNYDINRNYSDKNIIEMIKLLYPQTKFLFNGISFFISSKSSFFLQFKKDQTYISYDSKLNQIYSTIHKNDRIQFLPLTNIGCISDFFFKIQNSTKFLDHIWNDKFKKEEIIFIGIQNWYVKIINNDTITIRGDRYSYYICRDKKNPNGIVLQNKVTSFCLLKMIKVDSENFN